MYEAAHARPEEVSVAMTPEGLDPMRRLGISRFRSRAGAFAYGRRGLETDGGWGVSADPA